MNDTTLLGPWIRRFLLEYLVGDRNLSRNTQRSYRDALALLMPFASRQLKKTVDQISPTDLNADLVREFLTELEKNRGCGITTRNQRLAAIHALANFIGLHSPEHIGWSGEIRSVPFKKASHGPVPYLEKPEIDALLETADRSTAQGRRDHALLLFLYNTGARADEAAQALIGDLDLALCGRDHSSINIRGKGNKMRRCPLWPQTVGELRALIEGRASTERLFLNRYGQPTTRFGIYDLVERYVNRVVPKFPSLAKKRVSPHCIRHTTATHLLRSGVDRKAELLEVSYFHVVFTVPEEIAAIALQNKEAVYSILFRTTAETLKTIAADPKHLGAEIGFFAVLHSWGQSLQFHPHLHCVVPGGGPSLGGDRWVSCRPKFFLPVRVLSSLFRRLFLESLEKAFDAGKLQFFNSLEPLQKRTAFTRHLANLKHRDWVVYAKAPFAGPQQVLDYVGRYTHRVAISNNRLLDIENDQVRFKWKDYRGGDQVKTMTLSAEEFIRRFLLHVLPNGFQRIRYYGFLGNRHREEKLAQCRHLLGMPQVEENGAEPVKQKDYRDRYEDLTGRSLRQCPHCRQGNMIVVQILPSWSALFPAAVDTS